MGKGFPVEIEKGELYRLYVIERKSLSEIAEHFGCSTSCINRRVNEYKFRRHRKSTDVPVEVLEDMSKTMTVKEISDKLDIPVFAIYSKLNRAGIEYKRARKRNRKSKNEQNGRIKEMRDNGKSLKEISFVTGLSVSTVFRRLQEMSDTPEVDEVTDDQ